jgi:hypothetical protein
MRYANTAAAAIGYAVVCAVIIEILRVNLLR